MNTIKILRGVITIFVITVIMASCNSLRIAVDTTAHGERTILTSEETLFYHEDATISAALGENINGNDTLMGILIVFDSDINRPIFNVGDKMVFIFGDNTKITLKNLYNKEFESETTTTVTDRPVTSPEFYYCYDPVFDGVYVTPATVTRFVPEVVVRNIRRSYALYPISKPELQKIIDKGVAGVMIESDYCDMKTTHTENFSQLFAEMWSLLRAQVKMDKK